MAYRLSRPDRFETKVMRSFASCGSTKRRAETSDSIRSARLPAVSAATIATGPLRGYRLQDVFGDVEVRVDVLDVLGVLEPLDQPHDLARGRLVRDCDRCLRHHRELDGLDREAAGLQSLSYGPQRLRRSRDHE